MDMYNSPFYLANLVIIVFLILFIFAINRQSKWVHIILLFFVVFILYFMVPFSQPVSTSFTLTEPRHLGSALYIVANNRIDPHVNYHDFAGTLILLASFLQVFGGTGFGTAVQGMYLFLFIVQIGQALTLFLIGQKLFNQGFIFAVLGYIINNFFVVVHFTPAIMSFSLFLLFFYFGFAKDNSIKSRATIVILVFFFAVATITHLFTLLAILSLLLIALASQTILRQRISRISNPAQITLLCALLFLAWYVFFALNYSASSTNLISEGLERLQNVDILRSFFSYNLQRSTGGLPATLHPPESPLTGIIRYYRLFSYALVAFFALIAIIASILRRNQIAKYKGILLISILFPLSWTWLLPVWPELYLQRALSFSFFCLSALFCLAFQFIKNIRIRQATTFIAAIALILLVIPSFLSLSTSLNRYRSLSEMDTSNFIVSYYNFRNGTIGTDERFVQMLNLVSPRETSIAYRNMILTDITLDVYNYSQVVERVQHVPSYHDGSLIVRTLDDPGTLYALYGIRYEEYFMSVDNFLNNNFQKLYDSNDQQLYLNPQYP